MFRIEKTILYHNWYRSLDVNTRLRISKRLHRIAVSGHFGDIKSVGEGVFELRFFFGPGYRVYYKHIDGVIVLLLAGGDKSSQSRDIELAHSESRNY